MIPISEAIRTIREKVSAIGTESVPILESVGRVAAMWTRAASLKITNGGTPASGRDVGSELRGIGDSFLKRDTEMRLILPIKPKVPPIDRDQSKT